MNTRGYFRILRPFRTLVFATIQGAIAWALVGPAMGFRSDDARRLFLVVLAPLIVGKTLLRPLEDLMHRDGCALLPGAHRTFEKYHATASVLAAIALIAAGLHWNSGYPLPISATVVISMLVVPLFIDRQLPLVRRGWRPAVVAVNAVAAILIARLPEPIRSVLAWLVFSVAVGTTFWAFGFFFDRRRVREKGTQPYLNLQSVFFVASGFERTASFILPKMKSSEPGLDWNNRRMGGSAWSWIRVLIHVRFGRFKGLMRQLVKIGVLQVPALLLVIGMNVYQRHRGWGAVVADLLRPGNADGLFTVHTPMADALRMMMVVSGVVASQFQASAMRVSLPVSRMRQANYAWLYSLTVGLAFVFAQFGGMTVALVGLAAVVEHTLRVPLALPLVGMMVEVIVMVPLLLGALEVTRRFATNFGWSIHRTERLAGIGGSIVVGGLVPLLLPSLDHALGGPVVITSLLVVAVVASFIYRTVLQVNFLDENFATMESGPRGTR